MSAIISQNGRKMVKIMHKHNAAKKFDWVMLLQFFSKTRSDLHAKHISCQALFFLKTSSLYQPNLKVASAKCYNSNISNWIDWTRKKFDLYSHKRALTIPNSTVSSFKNISLALEHFFYIIVVYNFHLNRKTVT